MELNLDDDILREAIEDYFSSDYHAKITRPGKDQLKFNFYYLSKKPSVTLTIKQCQKTLRLTLFYDIGFKKTAVISRNKSYEDLRKKLNGLAKQAVKETTPNVNKLTRKTCRYLLKNVERTRVAKGLDAKALKYYQDPQSIGDLIKAIKTEYTSADPKLITHFHDVSILIMIKGSTKMWHTYEMDAEAAGLLHVDYRRTPKLIFPQMPCLIATGCYSILHFVHKEAQAIIEGKYSFLDRSLFREQIKQNQLIRIVIGQFIGRSKFWRLLGKKGQPFSVYGFVNNPNHIVVISGLLDCVYNLITGQNYERPEAEFLSEHGWARKK